MSSSATSKVAVVGFDGADWDYIEPLMEKGEMPNLESVIEEGGSAELETTYPVMSPVAWSSYSTGSDPSVHGIYDFMQREDGRFKPTTSRDIQKPYFWNQLGEENRAVVINVPMTFPAKKTNGLLVSGYLASNDTTYTYPAPLSSELNEDGYIIESLSGGYDKERKDQIASRANKAVEKRTDAALKLYERENPEFFQVTYTGLDRLQHYYPLEEDMGDTSHVEDHYKKLDESLGRLKNDLDENTTLIVMSDHGFQPMETEIYLNHWMKKEEYLKTVESKSLLGKLGITQQRIVPLLRRFGALDLAKTAAKMIGFEPSNSVPQPTMNNIDLDRTKAYAGNYRGAIFIVEDNVENPERFKEKLIEDLRGVRIEGEEPFRFVKSSDEIYSSEARESPDILVATNPGYHVVGFLGQGKLYTRNTRKSGIHALNGIIATNNEDIDLSDPHITDIAPTIMNLLDRASSDHMTGKSLVE